MILEIVALVMGFPITVKTILEIFKMMEKTSSPKKFINLLLIGETGSGKTSFIELFINYLRFEFDYKNYQENIKISNENLNSSPVKIENPSEISFTKKSVKYSLTINKEGKTLEINLVDTPGLNDCEGPFKDEENILNIIETIKEISKDHLSMNGVLFFRNGSSSKNDIFVYTKRSFEIILPKECEFIEIETKKDSDRPMTINNPLIFNTRLEETTPTSPLANLLSLTRDFNQSKFKGIVEFIFTKCDTELKLIDILENHSNYKILEESFLKLKKQLDDLDKIDFTMKEIRSKLELNEYLTTKIGEMTKKLPSMGKNMILNTLILNRDIIIMCKIDFQLASVYEIREEKTRGKVNIQLSLRMNCNHDLFLIVDPNRPEHVITKEIINKLLLEKTKNGDPNLFLEQLTEIEKNISEIMTKNLINQIKVLIEKTEGRTKIIEFINYLKPKINKYTKEESNALNIEMKELLKKKKDIYIMVLNIIKHGFKQLGEETMIEIRALIKNGEIKKQNK